MIDTDALALAGQLVKMAGLYEREAQGWADYPRVARRCRDGVDQITEAARHVIRTQDLVYGESWLIEAAGTLTHLQLVRLFRDGTLWQDLDPQPETA